MKSSALLAVVLIHALPWPGTSQIVARQGTAADSPLQEVPGTDPSRSA